MGSRAKLNPALDTRAINVSKMVEQPWVSFEDSRYCYWNGCLDEILPFSDDYNPIILKGASFEISPRLIKSPLKEKIYLSLPREAVVAINHICGEGSAFMSIANCYGHNSDGEVGTVHGKISACDLEEDIQSLLFRLLQEIPMSKIEPLIDDMPSEIIHTLIEHSKLPRSHVKRLDAQHRDSLFSIDLGL